MSKKKLPDQVEKDAELSEQLLEKIFKWLVWIYKNSHFYLLSEKCTIELRYNVNKQLTEWLKCSITVILFKV